MLNQHQTIRDNIAKYNHSTRLIPELIKLVGDRQDVKILDVGSGVYSTIGKYLEGVAVDLTLCDNQDFSGFWKKYKAYPYYYVEYQDMEHLTYPDDSYDIIHCANALDHTKDAETAIKEMIRVCKPDGQIYIDCHLDQADTGHKHFWNVKEDGHMESPGSILDLKDYGFHIRFEPSKLGRRYGHIIAIRGLKHA